METKGQISSQRHLDNSRRWRKRAELIIPGGAQTFSKSPSSFIQAVTPNFLVRGRGAHVWDVDGNRFLDYSMGLGPVILGYCHPVVNEAVRAQMEEGVSFSLPHPIEVEVAELLHDLIPGAEMVRFGKNGSDATAGAIRVARAYAKRDKVACCGYHGWQDWYIGSTNRHLGVPEAVRRLTLRFPYNDLGALDRLFRENKDSIACVIMEPVSFDPPQPGYLEEVKKICHRWGALLVFDEVITGFRLSLGGAAQHFGVTADLSCFGKAMANGFPLSAIVGRREVMRLFEEVFFSFTFGGEAVSLAACKATIKELEGCDGIEHLWSVGGKLKDGTNELITQLKLDRIVKCVGLPPFTGLRFQGNNERESGFLRSLFQQETARRGILSLGNHMLSLSHDGSIVVETLTVYRRVFEIIADAIQNGQLESRLEGPPLKPVLRQA